MELVRKRGVVLIDDEDAWVTHDHLIRVNVRKRDGYRWVGAVSKADGKVTSLGRLILGLTDPGLQADHINQNGFDNRRENLRAVDRDLQSANRRFNNPTGYKGVKFLGDHLAKPYRGRFRCKGGRYAGYTRYSPEKAALDYNRMAIAVWGHQSVLNESVRCVDLNPRPSEAPCLFCCATCHCCCVCFDPVSPSMQRLFDSLDAS